MKITSRLFAGLAALAMVLGGVTAFAPTPARAQVAETGGTLIAVGIFAAATVAALVLIDEQGDDEAPQSP
jgi:ABC-type uncharacterized transport system YnjBCD permease subunit